MEDAANVSATGVSGQIVIAGAGYAGLHVALRLTAKLRNSQKTELTLVDRHDYHQALTELPRVAGGTRAADAVRIPLEDMLAKHSTTPIEKIREDIERDKILTAEDALSYGLIDQIISTRKMNNAAVR